MIAPPGVDMASISAVGIRNPGEVVISYYGSRDGDRTFDGFMILSYNVMKANPSFHSIQTNRDALIQDNRLGKSCELVGPAGLENYFARIYRTFLFPDAFRSFVTNRSVFALTRSESFL
jgi:hypothetical protein